MEQEKIQIGMATKILAPSYLSLFFRLVTLEISSKRRIFTSCCTA